MNNKYVKIEKTVFGLYAYNKLTFPVGTIFEFVNETPTHISFHEVGRPNVSFTLTKALYDAGTFNVIDFCTNADLQQIVKQLSESLAESERLQKKAAERKRIFDKILA